MAIVTTNAGELRMLDNALAAEDYVLHLYQNNYTPTATSVTGDFTECDFTNYTTKAITAANWNAATTVSGAATATYDSAPQTWTCGTTGNTIYGYYIVHAGSGTVFYAEKYGTPAPVANGEVFNTQPRITLDVAP